MKLSDLDVPGYVEPVALEDRPFSGKARRPIVCRVDVCPATVHRLYQGIDVLARLGLVLEHHDRRSYWGAVRVIEPRAGEVALEEVACLVPWLG